MTTTTQEHHMQPFTNKFWLETLAAELSVLIKEIDMTKHQKCDCPRCRGEEVSEVRAYGFTLADIMANVDARIKKEMAAGAQPIECRPEDDKHVIQ